MRIATARLADLSGTPGRTVHGVVLDGAVHDVSGRWPTPADLMAEAVDEAGRARLLAAAHAAPTHALADVQLLPPIPSPARIICIGVNYADHAAETGRGGEANDHPAVFTRFASSIVGAGSPIERPVESVHFDYEGELAVIIGRRARSVSPDSAGRMVAGFACFMDGTLRDFQRHTSQFTPGKNFDRSGSFGPFVVTADEVGDGSGLAISTTVNGEVLQSSTTSSMIHDVARLVSYCSQFTSLEPGDVIATGTPSGVGAARQPPRWLVPGDEVVVSIDRVGELRNVVVDAPAADGVGDGPAGV